MSASPSIKTVLFDLDGTLLDTAPDFAVSLNLLRQRYHLPELDYDQIRLTVSHGARALITLAFGLNEGDDKFDTLRLELLDIYSQHLSVNTAPFPGIEPLLAELEQRQIAWGVVTNKPRVYTIPILEALGLYTRAQSIVCPDDVSRTKPDPEPLFLACNQIQCEPAHCVYIGDHQRDIEAGKRAGMTTIATAYGYVAPTDKIEDWQADYCVYHAREILPLLFPIFINT
ncbi:MAG: HAD-IA family hydrolase [Spongiibacteraceae bacterium]|nr:HAD-IA family hydrolase [Spongiibacteraceae bacterium]